MAKLSARGRTELVRMVREKTFAEKYLCQSCDGSGNVAVRDVEDEFGMQAIGTTCTVCEGKGERASLCTWERLTRCLMSDRTILEKRDVRFRPDRFDVDGRRHSYGWTVRGRAKEGVDAAKFQAIYEKQGFTRAGGSFVNVRA
jgi:hypothetical protein